MPAMLIWLAPFCGLKMAGWQLEQSSHSVCALCGYTTSGIEPLTSRTMFRSITAGTAFGSSRSARGLILPSRSDLTQSTRLPALLRASSLKAVNGACSATVPSLPGSWIRSSVGGRLRWPGRSSRLNELALAGAAAPDAKAALTVAGAAAAGAGAGGAGAAAAAGAGAAAAAVVLVSAARARAGGAVLATAGGTALAAAGFGAGAAADPAGPPDWYIM